MQSHMEACAKTKTINDWLSGNMAKSQPLTIAVNQCKNVFPHEKSAIKSKSSCSIFIEVDPVAWNMTTEVCGTFNQNSQFLLALLPHTGPSDRAAMPHPPHGQLFCTCVDRLVAIFVGGGQFLGCIVLECPHDVLGMAATFIWFFQIRSMFGALSASEIHCDFRLTSAFRLHHFFFHLQSRSQGA